MALIAGAQSPIDSQCCVDCGMVSEGSSSPLSLHKAHPGQRTAQTLKDSQPCRYIHGVRPDGPATWILKVGVRHSTGALACMRETR